MNNRSSFRLVLETQYDWVSMKSNTVIVIRKVRYPHLLTGAILKLLEYHLGLLCKLSSDASVVSGD